MLKKMMLLIIKYIPIVQAVGMLLNNTLYYFDVYWISYFLDYLIGNSIIFILIMFIFSYVFQFCFWYRAILISNAINMTIASIDNIYRLTEKDITLLLIYYTVFTITIIVLTVHHIKHGYKIKNNKKIISRSY